MRRKLKIAASVFLIYNAGFLAPFAIALHNPWVAVVSMALFASGGWLLRRLV